MSHTALSAAYATVLRKLVPLSEDWREEPFAWGRASQEPELAIELADLLGSRVNALVIGIKLLRYEAEREIEARKAEAV